MLTLTARTTALRATVALAATGLLLAPGAGPAAAQAQTVPAPAAAESVTDLEITRVAKSRGGKALAVTVRYRCAPGMLNQLVGAYDARSSFEWVGEDELYGQEESRVFDVPCTGEFETARLDLVTNGRLPKRGHVHAGIGVSDPADWSFTVANDSDRFRL